MTFKRTGAAKDRNERRPLRITRVTMTLSQKTRDTNVEEPINFMTIGRKKTMLQHTAHMSKRKM